MQNFPNNKLLALVLAKRGWDITEARLEHAQSEVGSAEAFPNFGAWLIAVLSKAKLATARLSVLPWKQLLIKELPALVLVDDNWVLIEKEDAQSFRLTSETGEQRTISMDEAQFETALWVSQKSQKLVKEKRRSPTAAGLVFRKMFQSWGWFSNILLATVIINIAAVATSLFSMQVYDRVIPTMAYATLATLVFGMAIVIMLDWLLKNIRARILDSVGVSVDAQVSRYVFDHLMHVRMDKLPASTGLIASQVSSLETVRQFMSSAVVSGLVDLPFAIFFVAVIYIIAGPVAYVYAVLVSVSLLLGIISYFRLNVLTRKIISTSNEKQGALIDAVRGAETIRATRSGWRFVENWDGLLKQVHKFDIKNKAIRSSQTNALTSFGTMATVSGVVVGVFQVAEGNMTMGAIIASSILGGRIMNPISQATNLLQQAQQVRQSLTLVDGLLAIPREENADQPMVSPDSLDVEIHCERVEYTYGQSPTAQLKINQLSLNPGDRIALIGPVGGGKSTLLKVLAGLYPLETGRITIGGVDLSSISSTTLERFIGYLPQNVHLFKGTIQSNVQLSGDVSDERLMNVVKDMGLDTIGAETSDGLAREIREGGEGLSGGQRQILALSRLILNRPRIWLMDEPTASMDAGTENKIWEVFKKHIRDDDIVVIASHKPQALLSLVNRVLVVGKGDVLKDCPPQEIFAPKSKTQSVHPLLKLKATEGLQ